MSESNYLAGLEAVAHQLGCPFSAEAVLAEIPVEDRHLPRRFVSEAATRLGIETAKTKKKPSKLSAAMFPALVRLRDGSVVALLSRRRKGLGKGTAGGIVVSRGDGLAPSLMGGRTLDKQVTGNVLVFRRVHSFDQRDLASNELTGDEGHWLIGTLWRNARLFSAGIVAGLFSNILILAVSLFTLAVYDRVLPNAAKESLQALFIGVVLALLLDFGLRSLRGHFVDVASRRIDFEIGTRVFARVLALKAKDRKGAAGGLVNTVKEFETVRDFFTSATLVAFSDLPFSVIFLGVIALIAGWLALVPAVAAVILVLLGLFFQRRLRRLIDAAFKQTVSRMGLLTEVVSAIDTVQASNAQAWARRSWEDVLRDNAETMSRSREVSQMSVNLTFGTAQMVSVCTVAFGAILTFTGDITSGAIIASVILSGRAMGPFAQIASLLIRANQTASAIKALNQLMKAGGRTQASLLARPRIEGSLTFNNVMFSYPQQSERASPPLILNGVRFHVRQGERVCILGRIGSGKSTILKTAIGLLEPDSGSALIDGIDVRQIDPVDLRRQIGYVEQDAVLFTGSIRDNISIGNPGVDDETVIRAAQAAGLDQALGGGDEGMFKVLQERGKNLSGGQRQGIALARALAADPKMLLLDEPTSMMDFTSERLVVERLSRSYRGRTVVAVTHREAWLAFAERIVVIDNGKIVMDGPKDKMLPLLQKGGPSNGGAGRPAIRTQETPVHQEAKQKTPVNFETKVERAS